MKNSRKSRYPLLSREFSNRSELAAIICKSETTITRVFSGERDFTKKERVAISNYLNMTEEELFKEASVC